jgi:hypothetical protein
MLIFPEKMTHDNNFIFLQNMLENPYYIQEIQTISGKVLKYFQNSNYKSINS